MKFNKRIFIWLKIIVFLAFTVQCSSFKQEQSVDEKQFNFQDVDVYSPFFWGYNSDLVYSWTNTAENLHPLDLGRKAMYSLYYGNLNNDSALLENGRQILELLMDYPYVFEDSTSIVYNYPFDHKTLVKEEWWSGMANSVISLAFYFGYELYNEQVYFDYFTRSMNGLIEDVSNYGSAVNTSDSTTWFLEYVHQNSSLENSYFVLNGFLFQLLAIDLIYKKTNNEIYYEAFTRGLNSLVEKQKDFYYCDFKWTYYMLNPLTVESVHYCIYDMLLLKSLYKSTSEPFFKDEIVKRSFILKQNFPISKLSHDYYDVYNFTSIGPPHPYWIDTYQIELRYYSDDKLVHKDTLPKKDFDIPVKTRGFLVDTFSDKKINYIGVYAIYNKDTMQLYGVTADEVIEVERESWYVKQSITTVSRDFTKVNDSIFILNEQATDNKSPLTRGTLCFNFKDSLDFSRNGLWGFLIKPEGELSNLKITVIDATGNSMFRYYLVPSTDSLNLVLLHKLGFNDYCNVDCSEIVEIRVDFYANSERHLDRFFIKVKGVFVFEDNFDLYDFFTHEDYYFPEKRVAGNIY
ncbi:MAG: D-glucuronyl C5-epimerase family protein [Bacteroidales bacterium]|jgi:hypothetical protein|nr:D-glucuronyl C5-epimerase family protein [Bacteroidales bacterium]